MTTVSEIPLQPSPQTFSASLGGVTYSLRLVWRNVDQGGWFLDIYDISGNPIVTGIPLVTGVNLLKPFGYLGFNFGLYVRTASDPDAVPTFTNLGTDGKLYVVTA